MSELHLHSPMNKNERRVFNDILAWKITHASETQQDRAGATIVPNERF